MEKLRSTLLLLSLISCASAAISSQRDVGAPQVTAMFVFGDSLTDCGNNNYLNSLAKANYLPYGVDFFGGPSGRFCNGRTIIDYLGDLLGLPFLPAYANPFVTRENILKGVNFASAAGGILEETGQNLGERFSFGQQVQNLEKTLSELKNEMDEAAMGQYLAKALVVIIIGSNDYINNYLQPSFYSTSSTYKPQEYADFLMNLYSKHINAVHNLGIRKFLLGGIGPLGCIPNQLATGLAPQGECVRFVNDYVKLFNARLKSLVDRLNAQYRGSIFVYGNTFEAFSDILSNASSYGFRVTDRACCGIGRNQGQITCLPFSVPCINRNQYAFWDAFHPTQAVNLILARRAYNGPPSDCYPVNVQQMAQM